MKNTAPEKENMKDNETNTISVDIRHLTDTQLKSLGMTQMAYVKSVVVDGEAAFAIHAADGTPMALAGDKATAFAAIIQQEMMPIMVH